MRYLGCWTASFLAVLIPLGVVAAANYNCSQFFTQPDGSPSSFGGDIASHLASKNCKADASLMTLFNSQIGRNMFDALAMTKPEGTTVDSCNAFVALLSFATMNNWLDDLCALGSLNSPGGGDERDYCSKASTYSEQLGTAIQTLQAHPALKGLSDLSNVIKSFTENPGSCRIACGSFVEAALCDAFVNTVTFVASKLRNGAEFTNIPSFDASAFGVPNLGQTPNGGSPAQRLFMYWWFVSNGYHPSQDSDQADIQTEYSRFVAWKKQNDVEQTIATIPLQPVASSQQVVSPQPVAPSQRVNRRDTAAASSRSGVRRSASRSKG